MYPVGAIFVPSPLKTGTNLLHPLPPQSLNGADVPSMVWPILTKICSGYEKLEPDFDSGDIDQTHHLI